LVITFRIDPSFTKEAALLCVVSLGSAVRRFRAGGRVRIGRSIGEKLEFLWAVVSGVVAYTFWEPSLLVIVAAGFVLIHVAAMATATFVASRWDAGDGTLVLPRPVMQFELAWYSFWLVLCIVALLTELKQ
jgi:hypothetical protein